MSCERVIVIHGFLKISAFCLLFFSSTQAMQSDLATLPNGMIIASISHKAIDQQYQCIFDFFYKKNLTFAEQNIRAMITSLGEEFDSNALDENRDTFLLLAIANSGDFAGREFQEPHPAQEMPARNIIVLLLSPSLKTELRFSGAHAGQTPLHRAAAQNIPPVVAQLLEAGAPVHIIDHVGRTPLHVALQNAGPDIVQMLVETLVTSNMVVAVLCHKDNHRHSIITSAKSNKLYKQQILEFLTNFMLTHEDQALAQLMEEAIKAQQE